MTTRKSLSCAARLKQLASEIRSLVVDDWGISYVFDYRYKCLGKAGRIILEGAAESQLPPAVGDAVRQARIGVDYMHERAQPLAVFLN